MTNNTGNAQPGQTGLTSRQLLQSMKDNFVVISGTALIGGVVLATTFLASYLSVFDWHLLWFVQYTDIITFGLLALGIISGSLIVLQAISQTIINLFHLTKASRVRWSVSLGVFFVLFMIWAIWSAVHNNEGYFHVVWSVMVIALGVIIILQITGFAISGTFPTLVQFTFLMILILSGAGGLGQWLGYSVLETEKPLDVQVKDTAMTGIKIVIVMSRHTVLLKDHDLFVVPTSDISQIHSVGLPWPL